jgi:hypothetical protein
VVAALTGIDSSGAVSDEIVPASITTYHKRCQASVAPG